VAEPEAVHRSPCQLAEEAAEAIRALNHATTWGAGYQRPADVDATVGGLLTLASRLSQALDQASSWLLAAERGETVRHDQGDDIAQVVDAARSHLRNAGTYAGWLTESLGSVQKETSHLRGVS
jgi:acyl-CoA reductase-like NAD-dependent aldehyde dehydrogenase